MPKLVVQGATLACSMGNAPSKLSVSPANETYGGEVPAATVQDMKPNVNIMSFGMCQSPTNPQVAAATAAAMGVLTPQPCIPMTAALWTPGSQAVTISDLVALNDTCQCLCQWGGQIRVQDPGQTETDID
jgi:hypothetical protein